MSCTADAACYVTLASHLLHLWLDCRGGICNQVYDY